MNLLHRHIFWSVMATCLAAVGLFAAVLILGNVLKDMMGYMLAGQIEPLIPGPETVTYNDLQQWTRNNVGNVAMDFILGESGSNPACGRGTRWALFDVQDDQFREIDRRDAR